jgi:hypothetical protein
MLTLLIASALAASPSPVDGVSPYSVDAEWLAAHPKLDEKAGKSAPACH